LCCLHLREPDLGVTLPKTYHLGYTPRWAGGKTPTSSTRNQLSRSEHHGDTALVSCTPGGGHGSWRNDNHQRNEGHSSTRGNNEQEVQQPPCNQHGARHHGQDQVEANLHHAPTVDLRQKINEGRDAQLVIEARRRDRTGRYHDNDDSNRLPAFTTSITDKSYPRTSNQSESPSMRVSRTRASGFDATPSPLKFQGDPTLQKLSTSRWLWSLRPSRGLRASTKLYRFMGGPQAGLHR
jgi:hypothetical protein